MKVKSFNLQNGKRVYSILVTTLNITFANPICDMDGKNRMKRDNVTSKMYLKSAQKVWIQF